MTISDYTKRLRAFSNDLIKNNRPFKIAVYTTTALIGERIFVKGQNSSGGKIGSYDTKTPLYVNPKKAPRAGALKAKGIEGLNPPTGKTGKSIFESTGLPHKTTYLKNYKEFRNRIGRRIDTVDLVLSGDLQSDWRNQKSLDAPALPIKINANEYHITLKRDINAKKMDGMNKKYGKISKPTKKEVEKFNFVALNTLLDSMKKAGL